jgi:hypothetical protein
MQVQGRVVELIDEEPIDKQFEARTNFERFAANVRWCIRPGRGLGETPMGQNQKEEREKYAPCSPSTN